MANSNSINQSPSSSTMSINTAFNSNNNSNNEYQHIEQLYKRIDILENENKSLKNNIYQIISTLQNNYNIIIDLNNINKDNKDNSIITSDIGNCNGSVRKKIKIDDNSSNCDNNNNKSIKLNETDYSELFYRVWHNVVLRNQILNYTYLFKKYNWVYIISHQELENHQFREYITELVYEPSTPIRSELFQSLSSLTSLTLDDFNQPLTKGFIPSSVKELTLILFNQPLLPNDQCAIPDSVTKLDLRKFNQALVPGSLPSSITDLELTSFNQPLLRGSIPNSVTRLSTDQYQLPLSKYSIPQSVTTLSLIGYTNQSLKNLPSSVSALILDQYGPIKEDMIPEFITKLIFIGDYPHIIDIGTFPSSIQSVEIDKELYEIGKDFQDAFYFYYYPTFEESD